MRAEHGNWEASYYDVERVFLRGMTVRDIVEPLPSFDAGQSCRDVAWIMDSRGYSVAGIRVDG